MAQKIRQGWLGGKDDEKLDGVVEVKRIVRPK